MPSKLSIWVEGIHDIKFLSDVLSECYGFVLEREIKSDTGECQLKRGEDEVRILQRKGKSQFVEQSEFEGKLKQKIDESDDRTHLFIIDADAGYDHQRGLISIATSGFNLGNVFLWPFNGIGDEYEAENLDLEQLLTVILQPQHQSLLDCWDIYEACLGDQYTKPAVKTKVYGIFEANHPPTHAGKTSCKEPNRNYRDQQLWDLNSSHLAPLKTFLDKHLN
jgi:hypothetical protein